MCDIFYIAHLTVRYFLYRTLGCALWDISSIPSLWSKVWKWYISGKPLLPMLQLYIISHWSLLQSHLQCNISDIRQHWVLPSANVWSGSYYPVRMFDLVVITQWEGSYYPVRMLQSLNTVGWQLIHFFILTGDYY